MMPPKEPPPPGGDYNRASQVYAFTWTLAIISAIFVTGRMYSRIKLLRNVWWDDWCICIALVLTIATSVSFTLYAGKGYARHLYYLKLDQRSEALKINTISRSLAVFTIAAGKVSVALLIERIAGQSNWRKWMLRSISISIIVTAIIVVVLFYVQCQPVQAVWDKSLIQAGTGKCLNPIPLNRFNISIGSYWTFLDFALALIPVDIVWKLQLSKRKKFLLSLLLSMGIFAGVCAAIKTSRIPITVNKKADITWSTIELLMWNAIEINVVIIAACIPTLRPLFLTIFNHPGASAYRPSVMARRGHSSYQKAGDYSKQSDRSIYPISGDENFDSRTGITSTMSGNTKFSQHGRNEHSIFVSEEIMIERGERGEEEEDGMPLREFKAVRNTDDLER